MIYRRRVSPLHSARAAAGCAYCLALAVAALTLSDPIALAAVAIAVAGAGVAAGVGRQLGRAALFALPIAASITVINALVTRDGLTVIARLGDLPVLGQTDVTLQAVVYGAILGLRAVTLILSSTPPQ
jgi:energy-coupling factor transport system permease protein